MVSVHSAFQFDLVNATNFRDFACWNRVEVKKEDKSYTKTSRIRANPLS